MKIVVFGPDRRTGALRNGSLRGSIVSKVRSAA